MMNQELFQIKICLDSLEKTDEVAHKLAGILDKGDLILLTGVIGSGKTTFIQALTRNLGVTENVTSPTFVLHTIYETGRILFSHVDLYRLTSEEAVESIGFEDYIDQGVTAIEWADRYSRFEEPYLSLYFEYGASEEERILTITPYGGDWKERLEVFGA